MTKPYDGWWGWPVIGRIAALVLLSPLAMLGVAITWACEVSIKLCKEIQDICRGRPW